MWFYVDHVLVPQERAYAAVHGQPRGNLSDLYPRWLGARELLLNHRDPYSPEITREIQNGYYGRALDPNRPEDPKDQQGFAYPVYVVFLLAPTVKLPFPIVQTGFRWLLVLLTLASVPLWLRVLRWRASTGVAAMLAILTLGSFPAVQGIKLQQLSLLVSAMIAASAALVTTGQLLPAGAVLALATIKPQLALPLALWLWLWALSDWRERWRLVAGFGLTAAVLLAASEYVLPKWFGHFREALEAYRQYTGGGHSLLDVLVTPFWGRALAALVVLALAVAGWRLRRVPADSAAFRVMLALVLTATVVIVPTVAPYNQLMLLPAVFLIAGSWTNLWRRNWLTRTACSVSAVAVGWPWLATCSLMLASVILPAASLQRAWAMPFYTSIPIPLAVLWVLTLYAADCISFANPQPAPGSHSR